jgi:hypothetical protein
MGLSVYGHMNYEACLVTRRRSAQHFLFINHELYLLTMSTIPDFAMGNGDSRYCTGSWQQSKALSFLLGQLCCLPELIATSVLHLDQLN